MQLSKDQQDALTLAKKWYGGTDTSPFKLFGLAGTGKSTLANLITQGIKEKNPGAKIGHAAYTGKAAHVMRRKGIRGASTIHSLVYKLIREEEGEPRFVLNTSSPLRDMDLLILDECSMIDKEMAKDLLSFKRKILVLGDPGQLPPISGDSYFSSNPHALLTTIHRQALDNPIIRDSLKVRKGEKVPFWTSGLDSRSKKLPKVECNLTSLKGADQILVGTNQRRLALNAGMRREYGFDGGRYPQEGEKLICLKNNHQRGIFNGGIFYVEGKLEEKEDWIKYRLRREEGGIVELNLHKIMFENPSKEDIKNYPKWKWHKAEQFDFAYAITCHKSQGSQWDSVVVIDDGFGSWAKDDLRSRWLYTAWTRASESIEVYGD